MLITPRDCLFANMSYGPRHVAAWRANAVTTYAALYIRNNSVLEFLQRRRDDTETSG